MPAKVATETCIGCGACTGVCPVEAVVLTDEGTACVGDACIECGACTGVCPVEAITLD